MIVWIITMDLIPMTLDSVIMTMMECPIILREVFHRIMTTMEMLIILI